MNQPHLLPNETTPTGPVTCLGLTFADDAERRAHFTELLREKLLDPAFRAIEGFPIGADEAILALSDPPYYTACPNPWLGEFIEEWQERPVVSDQWSVTSEEGGLATDHSPLATGHYHREPFAADVSEGKNDPIYNAHSYHTKVPHKAIMRYILHYTDPGDIVFDGFCGTGMTGVAAQLCGDRKAVEALGYRVDGDGVVYDGDKAISRLGARRAVLNDLSPAATFIAYNYNTPVDVAAFEREARRILKEVEAELGWMYETWHPHCDDPKRVKGKINFTVWSDVYLCPSCSQDIVFWDAVIDPITLQRKTELGDSLLCPHCHALVSTKAPERVRVTSHDQTLNKPVHFAKQVPVLINYSIEGRKLYKVPDSTDIELFSQIIGGGVVGLDNWFPAEQMPHGLRYSKDAYSLRGIENVHHFYSRRNLVMFSTIWAKVSAANSQASRLKFWLESVALGFTKLNRFFASSYSQVNRYLKGTLYVAPIIAEVSPPYALVGKLKAIPKLNYSEIGNAAISTCSVSNLALDSNSLDYVFIDPPFGKNLMYGELSFIWEAWLGVKTQRDQEAIVDETQAKNLTHYYHAMKKGFEEVYRLLRPGGWMTVEFHNSESAIWNVIQEGILRAGFVIADVRVLDKQQITMQQWVGTKVVDKDLVISAYKPNGGLEERFRLAAGTADGAWEFVRQHLGQLPVAVEADGGLEQVAERQDYLLFDRMVAFHIQRGAAVPLSAAEFYAGLRQRFDARDGMYFLKEQVPAYDAARLRAGQPAQLALFVSDEKSSIQWLRQQLDPALGGRPQTYQEIQPAFLRGLHQAAHEALPELRDLLQDSFLQDESGRWHAPDPNKAEDLERLRRRALLAEFETYLGGKGKLKQFRAEAVRAGFADAWRRKEFGLILKVAERLPERVVQEDPDLLMYYDTASLRN